jgi:hypothetical protein
MCEFYTVSPADMLSKAANHNGGYEFKYTLSAADAKIFIQNASSVIHNKHHIKLRVSDKELAMFYNNTMAGKEHITIHADIAYIKILHMTNAFHQAALKHRFWLFPVECLVRNYQKTTYTNDDGALSYGYILTGDCVERYFSPGTDSDDDIYVIRAATDIPTCINSI